MATIGTVGNPGEIRDGLTPAGDAEVWAEMLSCLAVGAKERHGEKGSGYFGIFLWALRTGVTRAVTPVLEKGVTSIELHSMSFKEEEE